MELEQNSAYNVNPSTSTVRPSSTLSETSDGYLPMGDGYEDVNGYEPPTMTVVDNQAYGGESTQMTIVDNQAYGEEPPRYDYIYPNSTELYEQIPDRGSAEQKAQAPRPAPTEKRVSVGKALCSFKQGRAEIGIRMSILILGALIIILHLLALGLNFISPSLGSLLVNLFSGTIWPGLIIIWGSVEFGMFFGRLCTKKTSKCFAIWDIVHSSILSIFYFLCAIGAIISTAVLASEGFQSRAPRRTSSGILFTPDAHDGSLSGAVIYIIIIILCFLQMTLYIVKACLMSAFINRGWDEKVEEYNRSLQARNIAALRSRNNAQQQSDYYYINE